jgi:hypothetical protein
MKSFVLQKRGDDGAVAVIVAIMIVVFVGLSALVVDVGYWYNVRRQLQTAADSAALAGCEQLKLTGSQSAAFTEALSYAQKNAVAPGDGLEVMPIGGSSLSSAVGSDYVKITVRKPAPMFFSQIFGGTSGYIVAQARAELQWVYGMRGLIPLALPVLADPKRVTATIGGVERDLTRGADGLWRAYGVPVGSVMSTTGKQMTIKVYNTQNIPTTIDDAGRVVVPPADCPVKDLVITNCYPVSGDPAGVDISFTSTTRPTGASLGNSNYNQGKFSWNSTTGQATLHMDAPTTSNLQEPFHLTLKVQKPGGTGNQDYELTDAATIVARRSTYPIQSVTLSQCIVAPGGTVDVTLKLHEYQYGERYEMKVVDGMGDTGHFMALNFGAVYHGGTSVLEWDDGSSGASTYRQYLGNEYPNVLHIGDVIYTEQGNMAGPTRQGLDDRIGSDSCTWSTWTSSASHGQACPRLVYVPVMEFYADKTGKRPLVVVNFASFFVEEFDKSGSDGIVYGRFIDYVSGGEILGENKPPVMGVQAPRLVADGLSY